MQKVLIEAGSGRFEAEMKDTPTARSFMESLPAEGKAQTWGKEIFFTHPLEAEPEPDAGMEVEIGDIAYWPSGQYFCIFFGPTPISTSDKPKGIDRVNVIGRIKGDLSALNQVGNGSTIKVSPMN